MTALGFELARGAGQTVEVVRAGRKPDPVNPARTLPDWGNPTRALVGGFVASSASAQVTDSGRDGSDSSAVLTAFAGPDGVPDVAKGDRIVSAGRTWEVIGVPTSDANPWTGWRPTVEAQLREVVG